MCDQKTAGAIFANIAVHPLLVVTEKILVEPIENTDWDQTVKTAVQSSKIQNICMTDIRHHILVYVFHKKKKRLSSVSELR